MQQHHVHSPICPQFDTLSCFTGSLVNANTNCSQVLPDPDDETSTALPPYGEASTSLPPEEGSEQCQFDSVAIVTTVAGMAGMFQLACALLRVGKFAWILSDILVSGYTTAAAIHVLISQLDSLFGLELESFNGVLVIPYVSS